MTEEMEWAVAWAEERFGRRVDGWQHFGQLATAARDNAALRDHAEILKRERDEIREALQKTVELCSELRAECDTLETALESQRQATEEAMRRAEEARRELAEVRGTLRPFCEAWPMAGEGDHREVHISLEAFVAARRAALEPR